MNNYGYLVFYWIIINLVCIFITVKDKINAKKHRQRTPEIALMILGLLGGAEAMYITMKIIHHKTKHIKFMLGLPVEIILHAVIVFLLTKYVF